MSVITHFDLSLNPALLDPYLSLTVSQCTHIQPRNKQRRKIICDREELLRMPPVVYHQRTPVNTRE